MAESLGLDENDIEPFELHHQRCGDAGNSATHDDDVGGDLGIEGWPRGVLDTDEPGGCALRHDLSQVSSDRSEPYPHRCAPKRDRGLHRAGTGVTVGHSCADSGWSQMAARLSTPS